MRSRDARGFTLLEVLISTAMLVMAITLSIAAGNMVTSSEYSIKNAAKAHNIAISLMEQLLANFSSDTNLTAGNHIQSYDVNGNLSTTRVVYTANWVVTLNSPITKIMQIQLYVTWQDGSLTRTVHFLTFRQS
jgi:Tfp pilus assembly protein PilV